MQGSLLIENAPNCDCDRGAGKLLRRRKFLRLHLRGLLSLIDNSKQPGVLPAAEVLPVVDPAVAASGKGFFMQ